MDAPWYRHWASDDLDEYCAFVREETDLRLGIEVDFLPGREDRVANLLDGRPDYVVGSIHFLRDEAVDLHGESAWAAFDIWRRGDPERCGRAISTRWERRPQRACSTSSPIPIW